MITKNKRITSIFIAIAALLFTPLLAMQFTDEVKWEPGDFLIAGVLLSGAGLLCELVLRKVKTVDGRWILCGAILLILVLVWMELAVGIFGTPFAGS